MGTVEEAVRDMSEMLGPTADPAGGCPVRVPGLQGGPAKPSLSQKLRAKAFFFLAAALILALTLALSSPCALGQGISISGQVVDPTGVPLPNAVILICPSTGSGIPCSPPASIYSSPTLSSGSLLPNPTTADQYGNYSLFVAPNYYIVQVEVSGTVVYSYLQGFAVSGAGSIFGQQPAYNIFGNCSGSTAFPTFCPLNANMIPSTLNATTINGLTVVGNATIPTILGPTSLTGTLAVSSTLSAAGETLTGALSGTTAAFSGLVTAPTMTATTLNSTALNVSGLSTLGQVAITNGSLNAILSINGSQTVTSFQGSTGTALATASGSFLNLDLICANSTSDITDCGYSMQNGPGTYDWFVTGGGAGTTVGTLTKLSSFPNSAVVIAATTDLSGVIGITVSKTSSSSYVQQSGISPCTFDGATTIGDYIGISSTVAGNCHDTGIAPPAFYSGTQLIGRVLSQQGSGGTYNMLLTPGASAQATKSVQITGVAVPGTNSEAATITWPGGGFADTNYSASCSVVGATSAVPGNAAQVFYLGYNTKTNSTINAVVQNLTGGSQTVSLECLAIHN